MVSYEGLITLPLAGGMVMCSKALSSYWWNLRSTSGHLLGLDNFTIGWGPGHVSKGTVLLLVGFEKHLCGQLLGLDKFTIGWGKVPILLLVVKFCGQMLEYTFDSFPIG